MKIDADGSITTNPNQHFQDLVAPTLSRTAKFSLMAKFCSKIASLQFCLRNKPFCNRHSAIEFS